MATPEQVELTKIARRIVAEVLATIGVRSNTADRESAAVNVRALLSNCFPPRAARAVCPSCGHDRSLLTVGDQTCTFVVGSDGAGGFELCGHRCAEPVAPLLHCSCGAAVTAAEYEVRRERGCDAGVATLPSEAEKKCVNCGGGISPSTRPNDLKWYPAIAGFVWYHKRDHQRACGRGGTFASPEVARTPANQDQDSGKTPDRVAPNTDRKDSLTPDANQLLAVMRNGFTLWHSYEGGDYQLHLKFQTMGETQKAHALLRTFSCPEGSLGSLIVGELHRLDGLASAPDASVRADRDDAKGGQSSISNSESVRAAYIRGLSDAAKVCDTHATNQLRHAELTKQTKTPPA